MSEQIPVRFLKNYCQYLRGDMAAIPADELQRLTATGIVAVIERQAAVETAAAVAPEAAVTRRKRAR